MATGLKALATRLGLREDSIAGMEADMGEAGLDQTQLAFLTREQKERLREIVYRTEVSDAIKVVSERVGTDFKPDERRVLEKVIKAAVDRSGRVAQLVKERIEAGSVQQAAEMQAVRDQVATVGTSMEQLQQMLATLAAGQVALLQQTQTANPADVAPQVTFTRNPDSTLQGSDGRTYVLMGGQAVPLDDSVQTPTPPPGA